MSLHCDFDHSSVSRWPSYIHWSFELLHIVHGHWTEFRSQSGHWGRTPSLLCVVGWFPPQIRQKPKHSNICIFLVQRTSPIERHSPVLITASLVTKRLSDSDDIVQTKSGHRQMERRTSDSTIHTDKWNTVYFTAHFHKLYIPFNHVCGIILTCLLLRTLKLWNRLHTYINFIVVVYLLSMCGTHYYLHME